MAAPLGSSLKFMIKCSNNVRLMRTLIRLRDFRNATLSQLRVNQHYLFKTSSSASYSNSRYVSTLKKDRKCWKCDSPTDGETEIFFCNCGVVQTVPSDLTYFQVMNSEEMFDIDVSSLANLYIDLQRKLHPDKYTNQSKEEQLLAEKQSAFINNAYRTLLKPLSRGQYLLELNGDPIEEANSAVDPDFLMEIMESNEDIAEACENMDVMRQLDATNGARMEQCVKQISKAFAANDLPGAKLCLIKLKYFSNIDDKIKDIYTHLLEW